MNALAMTKLVNNCKSKDGVKKNIDVERRYLSDVGEIDDEKRLVEQPDETIDEEENE